LPWQTPQSCDAPCPPWEAKWTDVGRGSTSQGCARAVGELQPNAMESLQTFRRKPKNVCQNDIRCVRRNSLAFCQGCLI
ncbi:unnamed protein product, partial [Cladocopium goreaui]